MSAWRSPISPPRSVDMQSGGTRQCGWGAASEAASSRPLKESIPLDASCIRSSFLTSLDTTYQFRPGGSGSHFGLFYFLLQLPLGVSLHPCQAFGRPFSLVSIS